MNRMLHFLVLFALCTVAVSAQTAGNATIPVPPAPVTVPAPNPAQPPPFINLSNDPRRSAVAVDQATLATSPALRARLEAAHAVWASHGGAEFHPSFGFAGGAPILMLIQSPSETPAAHSRRLKAAVQACQFMIDDSAFEHAVISVVTCDPKNPAATTVQNVTIHRGAFQAAAKHAGKAALVTDALTAAFRDDNAVKQICSDLGIK